MGSPAPSGSVVLLGCGRLGSAIVEGWLKTGAVAPSDLIILTPSDKPAAEAAKALAAAGATVHLAGRPGEHEAALRQAGVKSFIFVGCDVLSTLQAAHDSLRAP